MGNAVTNPGRFIEKKVFDVPREKSVFVDHPRRNHEAERQRQRELEETERQRRAAQQAHEQELRRQREALERERQRHQEECRRQEERRQEERRQQEEARRQQAITNYQNEFNAYSNNASDLQRQISTKQEELLREEKIEADLTRQRNDERALLAKFGRERSDMNVARIVLVGETGVGKSTVANRLIGDDSRYCDSSAAVFRVNNGIHSQTSEIQKEVRNVRLANGSVKTISVTDTPGLSDSTNRDRHHANLLCEYLKGVERVHSFVIVMSIANPRLDEATIRGLHRMTTMFGRKFWYFVSIVYTNVDDDRSRAVLPRNVADLQGRIREEFGLGEGDAGLKLIGIGIDDWQAGVMEVIEGADTRKYYTCDLLESPLQQLETNVVEQSRKVQSVRNDVANIKSRLSSVQKNMERVRSSLKGYGVCV